MKNTFLPTLVMLLGFAVTAQTDNVTLNVRLKPIQTLVVNPMQKTVNLDYTSEADYENGVSSLQVDHLEVFSTGGFQVKVKSSGDELTNSQAGVNGNIAANTIQIIPTAATNAIPGAAYESISLSSNEQTIVSTVKGAVAKKVNVEYKGANANAYIDYYVADQNPTVYTTTLTYTIIAQ